MNNEQAKRIVQDALGGPFDKANFVRLVKNILNHVQDAPFTYAGNLIFDDFEDSIQRVERIGKYRSPDKKQVDVLIVHLKKEASLERARTMQRNFVAKYLKGSRGGELKDAALVAFVAPNEEDWRLSLVKIEYKFNQQGKVEEKLSPARRHSFLVGQNENSYTARSRLVPTLLKYEDPTLEDLEDIFSVEPVTKEFFEKYRDLFLRLKEQLDKVLKGQPEVELDFTEKGIDTADFAKKLLGQIVFLYFLQKKGWFGVKRGEEWGEGSKNFLRELFEKKHRDYQNFYNDILEPLFYEALRLKRPKDYYSQFDCRIPFLNGGLFDPLNDYNWEDTDILLPDGIFSNSNWTKEGDIGDGILDIFDRYNFTVNENEPLEKEVAVDPEMLGKVFENLLPIKDRKSSGTYYTPREIVQYMCRESLINHLVKEFDQEVSRGDIETLVEYADIVVENERHVAGKELETQTYAFKMPEGIRKHADLLDKELDLIRVCDPAAGSGAFLVGMMNEIVRVRSALAPYIDDGERAPYKFKRRAIEYSLYGVDIDSSAVEIAKLRLWLSLIVDEEDRNKIRPLPNLDYKIVQGNSLLSIERDMLNYSALDELEQLKPIYFNETATDKKQEHRERIEKLIDQITGGEFDFKVHFSEVFHEKKGFDVLIANPPYVGEKGNKDDFREIRNRSNLREFYRGKVDILYFFFHLALNLGHYGSNIAFITTNYYVTATGATNLRKDLKERATILRLINFNELKLFESALGQHNMITILQKGGSDDEEVHIAITHCKEIAKPTVLRAIFDWNDEHTDYYQIEQKDIYEGDDNYIRLAVSSEISKILEKIKQQGILLKSFCQVNTGIQTGADKVSKKHLGEYGIEANIGDGIFVLSKREISGLSLLPNEKEVLKDWFKNSDIKQYYTSTNAKRSVLYLRKQFGESDIPNIICRLSKFKPILSDRDECRYGKRAWYDLDRPRDQKIFDGPKIVAPQRSHLNTFGYNEIPWYASADVYFITEKDTILSAGLSLKYILALLNSQLYYVWLYHRGKRKGEMLELYQTPLSEIPIKKPSPDEQKPFIELVDKILAITNSEDYLQNPTNQVQVCEYQKQIDQLVYELYDLTPDEIKIIEKGNNPK